ncbi:MAG: IPT/TIG domain-containing protein [Mangrovibacterium sp.]|jgi:DNA-binding beta-propeller fold protein YncE
MRKNQIEMKVIFNHSPGIREWIGLWTNLALAFLLLLMAGCINEDSPDNNPYDRPHDPAKSLVVTGIGPERGGYGTRVVISGSNFGNDSERVSVYFNEKEALILGIQDNAIYAMCPKQPGDLSTIKVAVQESDGIFTEAELAGTQFKYLVRAAVTTVAGVLGKSQALDGPALEASFQRPAKVAADIDGKNIIVVDDNAAKIRLLSLTDNKVVTVASVSNPFPCVFNTQYDKCFVGIRAAARRPELFVCLSKENNYMSPVMFYDQRDENGNYLVGNTDILNIAADDQYVYQMSMHGAKLIRVHQTTGKVEVIGQNLDMTGISNLTFNPKDRKIYAISETTGRLNRFDPYHTPTGRTTPWITNNDVEYVLGNGIGSPIEGYGEQARCPCAGITTDRDGNIYGADFTNHVIWKFDVIARNAAIFAGTPGLSGYKDGKPLESMVARPLGLTVTADGIVYIADTNNYLIRRVSVQ